MVIATSRPPPSAAALKAKQRKVRDGFSEALTLRVHRSISWLIRAEAEKSDLDARFILLWISFNSAYASNIEMRKLGERDLFKAFFDALVSLDKEQRIFDAVWQRFPSEFQLLLANKYVFAAFWHAQNGVPGFEDWAVRMDKGKKAIRHAMQARDTARVLSLVFDRLYVLRNQLLHGGATWNSSVNRNQVRDGAAVLGWLLPIFVDVMMDNPDRNWGKPFYPVVS
jgi:hypothetical protein